MIVRKLEFDKVQGNEPDSKELIALADKIINQIKKSEPEGLSQEKLILDFTDSSPELINQEVKKALEQIQPDVLICCHIHEAEGIEERVGKTRVINVGKMGKVIDI